MRYSTMLRCLIMMLLVSPTVYAERLGKVYQTSHDYDVCMQQSLSSQDALSCMDKELKRQDKRLNINYHHAMASIEPFRQKDLRRVQRQWLKYRDARCSFYYHKHSGSGGLLDQQECLLYETMKRADELGEL